MSESDNPTIITYLIKGGAHHLDLRYDTVHLDHIGILDVEEYCDTVQSKY